VSTKQAEVASLCVGYESAELKLKELGADQILYAFFDKVTSKNPINHSIYLMFPHLLSASQHLSCTPSVYKYKMFSFMK
jgi:hypothetical protein